MSRKIVFTSGKGGVGKSTIVANLGVKLSQMGDSVLLIDCDFGLNNLDVLLGIENKVPYDLIDAVMGKCRPKQALIKHNKFKNLCMMSSNHLCDNKYISPKELKSVIESVDVQFDYILIDCPAGIDSGFHRAVSIADEAIVLSTPHISSLRDADKVISLLKNYKLNKLSLLVNMVRGDLIVDREILSPKEIYEIMKVNLIGVIPESDLLYLNGDIQGGVNKAFKLLASNIKYNQNKIYDTTTKYVGVLGGIKRSMRKSL